MEIEVSPRWLDQSNTTLCPEGGMEIEVSPLHVTSTDHKLNIPFCLERFMCLRQRGILVSWACIPHRILTDT